MLMMKLQYFGHPDEKSQLTGKDPDAGKDWRQEEKGMAEDEMTGWHHRLDGLEFEQVPGAGDGQGGLASCGPWDHQESDTTEGLNWTGLGTGFVYFGKLLNVCYFFCKTRMIIMRILEIITVKPSVSFKEAVL